MLLEFKVTNFRSIKDTVTVSMYHTKRLKEEQLDGNIIHTKHGDILPSLIMYGRNASGKSNILKAFFRLQGLVLYSAQYTHNQNITAYEPYKFDEQTYKKPVEFAIEFIANDKIKYLYRIKFNSKEILAEELYFFPNNVQAVLYIRKEKNEFIYGESVKGNKKNIESDLLPNQLFLSKSATSNIQYLREVFLFFNDSYQTFDFELWNFNNIKNFVISKIQSEGYYLLRNINQLLAAADTNIAKVNITENNFDELNLRAQLPTDIPEELARRLESYKFELISEHSLFKDDKLIGSKPLDFFSESFGTKNLLILSIIILPALQKGGVVIIDELDKSLHSLLSTMLIKLFHSKENNPNNAQLIFATHDNTLLNNELFRRDQICFVDKHYEGNTFLNKLSDYKGIRKDIPYDKWYLSGRFKAIPVVDEIELDFNE